MALATSGLASGFEPKLAHHHVGGAPGFNPTKLCYKTAFVTEQENKAASMDSSVWI
jgi:hypothetical protein